jgi:hypothetical protein
VIYYSSISFERLRKTARNLSQYSCTSQEWNQASARHVTASANRFNEHSETAMKKEMKKEIRERKKKGRQGRRSERKAARKKDRNKI